MSKQLLARNIVWNKHYKYSLAGADHLKVAREFLHLLEKDQRIQYCLFSIERGAHQQESSFHFQGYLEFNCKVDILAFKRAFELTDVQVRAGSQLQAISYVRKECTKLSTDFFEFGAPKKQGRILTKYNTSDADIRSDLDLQRVLLNRRIKENYYSKFTDIEQDLELLFIKNEKWCKNLWDKYHPVQKLDVVPAKTIWIYGRSGIGKTVWTNNYLKENGYTDQMITRKKASSETRPKLWFDLEDENSFVLWIEEIRENFPEFNDIIQLIDKGTRLEVKGSSISNNFDLIIFNSLYSPEVIYQSIRSSHQIEILRRLYQGREAKVYLLLPAKQPFNRLIDKTNELPQVLLEHLAPSV